MYFYILSELTCGFLWVASYDASSAAIATKSIIAFLCEMCQTLLFLVLWDSGRHACAEYAFVTKSTKIVQPVLGHDEEQS